MWLLQIPEDDIPYLFIYTLRSVDNSFFCAMLLVLISRAHSKYVVRSKVKSNFKHSYNDLSCDFCSTITLGKVGSLMGKVSIVVFTRLSFQLWKEWKIVDISL